MAARQLHLALDLLDRQVVDPQGRMVGKVDDLEVTVPADGSPAYVSAVLLGPAALAPRLGGLLGRWLLTATAQLSQRRDDTPDRIGFELVTDVDSAVHVARSRAELGVEHGEDRAREYFVERIPGAGHAGQ